MNVKNITDRVTYCGVNDRTTAKFENLWSLPYGVTYNSYIVRGSEGAAIIEGCEAGHASRFIGNVIEALNGGKPDYLVVNHVEPDHSGAIPMIKTMWPDIKIVGNVKTIEMIKGFYGVKTGTIEVREGDTIGLGDRTLRFFLTPMTHWPETMVTYLEEEGVAFTGDIFGCFGALDGAVSDDEMADARRYFDEMRRYYACIVAKYGVFAQKTLAKLAPLNITRLCSTHGPVWHSLREEVIGLWSRWAAFEADPGVVVAYGSMYGSTAEMAEELAMRLAAKGIREIRVHDLSHAPLSRVLADVMRFNGLVLASPTYNTEIYPPVAALVEAIISRGIKNRHVAITGSYTWGGQAVRKLGTRLAETGLNILSPTAEMKQSLIGAVKPQLDEIAAAMAQNCLQPAR
ncbi:MAG: FprA family A-type flavoprotein [Candidatus Amulumruptor caecigallinarius]|nr:FprA family A-type flavoprotein [Candidatus Amulumruptor caecigallinarius]MCM1396757.1 FprA family A-type flavoprotein [Candidatus Amulumruptor caecigallinarius]MCM1453185.1 FprA family A-type flavoprotein [bacterium]